MSKEITKTVQAIDEQIARYTRKLSTLDYREVLEELQAVIEARLAASREEHPNV